VHAVKGFFSSTRLRRTKSDILEYFLLIGLIEFNWLSMSGFELRIILEFI
jgi:hypothetical protein